MRPRLIPSVPLGMYWLALVSAVALGVSGAAQAPPSAAPSTVIIPSGTLRLSGLLWKPAGQEPFPAVLFTHGAGRGDVARAHDIGPVFAKHGYALLYLFRRGHALSAGQGRFMGDVLDREVAAKGEGVRLPLQLTLLTTEQLDDVTAGLAFLRTLQGVDPTRIAVSGHSFGGQLALLAAERDTVRAALTFAAAAQTWDSSPELQRLLLETVGRINVPVFLNYAANDFSLAPGNAMAAEMANRQKPYQLKIYPPVGKTAGDGHGAVYTDIITWEREVFPFLDQHMRPGREPGRP